MRWMRPNRCGELERILGNIVCPERLEHADQMHILISVI
jgi:hypothetical protein